MSEMETREVKLGDIVKYNKGYAFKSSEYTDEGVMVVRVTDFTLDSISDVDAVYLAPDDRYDNFILKTNDILIQTVGSWANNPNSIVGKVVRVPNQCDSAYLNQNIVRIIPNNDFNNTYLFYALKANQFSTYCVLRGQGAANQASITLDTIFRFKFKVHNFAEQKRIADILTTYDNLIENNNKRIKLLEQMAENLYKEWFVRFRFPGYENVEFENGLPKGWEILRANQLFDITIGKTPDRKIFEYFSNIPECNYLWISISDMRSASTFVFKTKEYLTFNAVNTCNVKIIPKNTVLVSFKLTVGQVAITTSDMCTNEAIAHFTTDNATMREYIYLYLKKFQYSDLGNTSSIGTAVNSKIIKNMKIILPSSELLNRFHDYAYSIFEEIRLLNETNNNLTKQRDIILPRLMSGRLEV